jgi:hypothetical protein
MQQPSAAIADAVDGATPVNATLIRTLACVLAASVANPMLALGQAAPPPAAAQPEPTQTTGQAVFRMEEIDQMTAPIALYPDELLAQVLVAATYPLEVVQAERWVSNPANAKLKGDELAAALEAQPWDPSVKSLVPFPQVLKMMSDKIDWTQRLGDAFLAQQPDVMSSVQRLRRQAQEAGNLKSTEQQTVVTEKETVVIQPANPEVVYVPTYNPTVVYGTWPYPSYPPAYYPPPPAYYPGYYPGSALMAGIGFGLGVAVVGSLWGWGNCNWGGNNININASRYNNINAANIRAGRATQLPANASNWRHNPAHRGGVAYRDPATRQNFQRQAGAGNASRDFRGYDGARRSAGQGTSRPPGGGSQIGQRQGGAAAGSRQAPGQTRRQPAAAPGSGAGRGLSQRTPSAFQGVGNGSQTRMQSNRGRSSLQSSAGRAPRSAPSGGTRGGGAARAGGGMRGGGRR